LSDPICDEQTRREPELEEEHPNSAAIESERKGKRWSIIKKRLSIGKESPTSPCCEHRERISSPEGRGLPVPEGNDEMISPSQQ